MCTNKCLRPLLLAVAMLLPAMKPAAAATISSTSSGYGMSTNINALGISLNLGPLPTGVVGAAPAPYNLANAAVNVSVSNSIPLVINGISSASAVNATAVSNVDALPGSRTTSATGGVVGAHVNAVTLPVVGNGLTIIGLDGTLSSSAQITGDFGSLAATGTTTIQSLSLTLAGTPVNLAPYVGVSVAPNTSINLAALGILNATLILNEQIIAPNQSSIVVNALHLSTNLLNISGDVILGHSQASVNAVPEPHTLSMVAIAVIAAAQLPFRRRRTQNSIN